MNRLPVAAYAADMKETKDWRSGDAWKRYTSNSGHILVQFWKEYSELIQLQILNSEIGGRSF